MDKMQIDLAKVIENYFGADAAYLDIDVFTLAKRIMEAGYTKQEAMPKIFIHSKPIDEDLQKAIADSPVIYSAVEEVITPIYPDRWIPVTERLPEHGDIVLCYMKFGEQRILQWDNVSSWWLGYGRGDDWQKADVTHWTKMPEPPKGD